MNHNDQEEISAVWDRYKAGTATGNDLALLESWYMEFEAEEPEQLDAADVEERLAVVRRNLPIQRTYKLWPRFAVAASLVFALGIGYYFYQQPAIDQLKREAAVAGITAGRNKAILKLADGSEIALSDAHSGTIAAQSGTEITMAGNGKLVYTDDHQGGALKLNVISTPRGGKWQLQLPDGTRVWLNSATTLSYPVTFDGQKERRVELNGEAYFEVAKDKAKPFLVHSARQEVQVLGTHFNVNTYDNEPVVKTTLLEGSVEVRGTPQNRLSKVLKPGEQAALSGQAISIAAVNVRTAVDWKNDEFRFKNEPLNSILRKVARWYDVNIVYEGQITEIPTFSGSVSRFDDVSAVLKMLEEASDVHFSIKGKNIYVKK